MTAQRRTKIFLYGNRNTKKRERRKQLEEEYTREAEKARADMEERKQADWQRNAIAQATTLEELRAAVLDWVDEKSGYT